MCAKNKSMSGRRLDKTFFCWTVNRTRNRLRQHPVDRIPNYNGPAATAFCGQGNPGYAAKQPRPAGQGTLDVLTGDVQSLQFKLMVDQRTLNLNCSLQFFGPSQCVPGCAIRRTKIRAEGRLLFRVNSSPKSQKELRLGTSRSGQTLKLAG